jgi:RNA polymerase sigma factor (sigma-70 family)
MNAKPTFPEEMRRSFSNDTIGEAGVSDQIQAAPRYHSAVLEEIWRAHAQRILRVTQRITNNREDAEDALQDSFLRAHVYLHSFDGRSSIVTWLTRIAINSALMILRKRAGTPQLLSIDGSVDSGDGVRDLIPADQGLSPEEQCAGLERVSIARHALATVRPSIRRALELQTLEERSIKDVAGKMGLSITATKSRIFHAKAALRKSLDQKVSRRSHRAKQLQLSRA